MQTVPVDTSSPGPSIESGTLAGPAVLVHGGAGNFARLETGTSSRGEFERGLASALAAGWDALEHSGSALGAAVEAVVSLEDSGLFNAGRGSTPTIEGIVETDASVMDGQTGSAGAVCAATWPANPVRAALAVANLVEEGETWPPLLLAGRGADRLAEAAGLARMSGVRGTGEGRAFEGRTSAGTVGAVALDAMGHVAAATSTGGRSGQMSGRVGDSPIIGAGTWADDSTVALSATGQGEAFILAGFGHRVDWATQSGLSLPRALEEALSAVVARGGTGGAIAITAAGQFATIFNTPSMARGWRNGDELVVRV